MEFTDYVSTVVFRVPEDAWDLFELKGTLWALLFWSVVYGIAKWKNRARHMQKLKLEARSFATATLMSCGVVFLFLLFIYSPYQQYRQLHLAMQPAQNEVKEVQGEMGRLETENKKLNEELKTKEARIEDFVRKLPPPVIDNPIRKRLKEALKHINGPKRILIKYLESTDASSSRSIVFAQQLADIFESASWHVRMFSAKKGEVIGNRFAIRHEDGAKIPPVVKAIQDAFLQAGLPLGSITMGQERIEQIEIQVGEM